MRGKRATAAYQPCRNSPESPKDIHLLLPCSLILSEPGRKKAEHGMQLLLFPQCRAVVPSSGASTFRQCSRMPENCPDLSSNPVFSTDFTVSKPVTRLQVYPINQVSVVRGRSKIWLCMLSHLGFESARDVLNAATKCFRVRHSGA